MKRAVAAFPPLAVVAAVVVLSASIKAGEPPPSEEEVPDQKGMTVEELDALVETTISPGLDGKFYNEFPVAFHEIGWNFLIDAREAAAQKRLALRWSRTRGSLLHYLASGSIMH